MEHSKTKPRMELPDFLRGCAMLLVIWNHSGLPPDRLILGFHMPLFFLLSGFLRRSSFERRGEYRSADLKRRFSRLVIPYLCFEGIHLAISAALALALHRPFGLSAALRCILLVENDPVYPAFVPVLWFLPCMFVCDLYQNLWMGRTRQPVRRALLGAPLFFGASKLLSLVLPGRLPFTLDTALMGTAFLLLGFAVGKWAGRLTDRPLRPVRLVPAALLLALCAAASCANEPVYLYVDEYGSYLLMLVSSLSGSAAFLIFAGACHALPDRLHLRRVKDFVLWTGVHSLTLFPAHIEVQQALRLVFHALGINSGWVMAPLLLFGGCLFSVPLVWVYEKFLPGLKQE